MTQGASKGSKAKFKSGGRKKGGLMKKGKREIAPKNKQKVVEKAQKKVSHVALSSGISRYQLLAAIPNIHGEVKC